MKVFFSCFPAQNIPLIGCSDVQVAKFLVSSTPSCCWGMCAGISELKSPHKINHLWLYCSHRNRVNSSCGNSFINSKNSNINSVCSYSHGGLCRCFTQHRFFYRLLTDRAGCEMRNSCIFLGAGHNFLLKIKFFWCSSEDGSSPPSLHSWRQGVQHANIWRAVNCGG